MHHLVAESHLHLAGVNCHRNPFSPEENFRAVTPCLRPALLAGVVSQLLLDPRLLALRKVLSK